MTKDPHNDLEESCRTALDELQDERPAAKLIATHGGDWAFISIGRVRPKELSPVFDEPDDRDVVIGIVRIPTNFPEGEPYGVVVIPPLQHVDGNGFDDQTINHNHAQPVLDVLEDVDEVGWISCKWRNVQIEQPADLCKAPDVVRAVIRKVAQNELNQ